MHRPDAELVAAACQGDLTSFGLLYERHYRMAVGIARARLADHHLAEDAAQETFAIAWRTLPTLRDRHRFPQWLGTICRRTASRLDAHRPTHEPLPDAPKPACDSDLRLQVQDALQCLEETSREIVLLHYFSGLSYDEIGQALDLSVQSIHGRLQRARGKLAKILDAHDSSGAKT
ncbi:RNA polymerase sigma-70 factor, ECF subfamily [Singulisphaera sp. GP187]|uniref:RNA polymerase sigma factor n=1 Tax=Singulisphaera sp. GP187 TaxID=1882752 RepID=UPI000926925A|nr:sigma-70 family RNA polymerase sigma factor [Singulisphaera sp. GP187]SIO56661.1 RNA polymerase sigma-70 factor, ECF subfamily [Singulisphaera sp. GP187]